MKRFALFLLVFLSLGTSGAFAASTNTGSGMSGTVTVPETPKTVEKRRAIEDVNALIIDSYRVQLDRILKELYENIRIATKGNADAQIKILDSVRSDLDNRLDTLSAGNVSGNRKKILMGVYFYLKSRIEARMEELKSTDK